MNELRERLRAIGISESIIERMLPLEANVLAENNLLLRTCEHGVKHPVGHLDRVFRAHGEFRDQHYQGWPCSVPTVCCGCCEDWPKADAHAA